MKKRSIVVFALSLCIINMVSAVERTKYNFNPDWKIFIGDDPKAKDIIYNDTKWQSVNLPAAFNEKKEVLKTSMGQQTDTVAWYRKTFQIPSEHKGQKIFIEFEGARQAAEVWVNGHSAGLYENGVMAFGFDITQYVTFGRKSNVIAVRVNNSWNYKERATGSSFQWNDRNFYANYGGLNKNVWLYAMDKLYQTLPIYSDLKTKGVYVYADNYDIKGKRAVLHIESEVRNEYNSPKVFRLNVMVRDNDGLLVREFKSDDDTIQPGETKVFTASGTLKNIQFWSWGYGYLYEVNTSLTIGNKVMDMVRTRTGFRKTEFTDGVFKLNDRVLQLKGYTQNSTNEWPGVGSSIPAWLSDYSNNLMVESCGNLVRWLHVTPWKQDIESCDRVGLIEEMPAGDSQVDASDREWEQRKELMRDAIIYNRNNPSVVFYECGNAAISEDHMAEMLSIRNEYDLHGGRIMGAREMLDSKTAEYSGEMHNIDKSAGKPFFAMGYCQDGALRKNWDDVSYPFHKQSHVSDQDTSAYNQNQDLFAIGAVVRWYDFYKERPGSGRRVNAGGLKNVFSDFNSNYGGLENNRFGGDVDAMRIKKDAWWAHSVMWDGWVDLEKIHSHIVGHWNYHIGTRKNVYVISSGDKVELFLNKKSLGFGKQTSRFLYTFKDVAYQPGVLRAVSYDQSDKAVSEATCQTAGSPKSLKLNLIKNPDGFKADGSDMVMAEVEVVDANGQRCPLANDTISFDIKGPVEFIGGIAQGENDFVYSKKLPVEAGVNRILLRSTKEAGAITVIANSEHLISDSLNLSSQAVDVNHGLSSYLPSMKLASRLTRGATPLISSFVVSRIPVSVDNVTAGSNEKDVLLSIDDNECSEWRNSGSRSTAWIKYDLVRQANLSEISLKLSDWSTRSYKIRVLAEDGTVLWEGDTERSLGYITLPLRQNVLTKSVRVELLGAGKDKEKEIDTSKIETNKISNQKVNPKDELRIVEIEFYEIPN
jgi:hypothetical protein